MRARRALLLGLLLALAAGPLAAETYRYVDAHGGVVLDHQGVPPEHVAGGYEVLDERGRVVRVVPPAPSAEELRRRAEGHRQAQADARLRRLYPRVADLEVAQERRLRDLDSLIAIAHDNVQTARDRMLVLERQAAEQQRGGQPVPAPVLQQREDLQRVQQHAEAELQRLQALRRSTAEGFAADRARLVELLGGGS